MRKNAFTLLETMIAVTIITLAVAGPLYTASRAVVASQIAKDQLTASYLAQEGIEYVRRMRDDEFLKAYQAGGANISSAAWTAFISGSDAGSITQCRASTCTLDPTRTMGTGSGLALQTCSGSSCTPLYLLPSGLYSEQNNISGSVQTPYTRTIQAIDLSPYTYDEGIVSKVTWVYHGTTYTVRVIDHVTQWQ